MKIRFESGATMRFSQDVIKLIEPKVSAKASAVFSGTYLLVFFAKGKGFIKLLLILPGLWSALLLFLAVAFFVAQIVWATTTRSIMTFTPKEITYRRYFSGRLLSSCTVAAEQVQLIRFGVVQRSDGSSGSGLRVEPDRLGLHALAGTSLKEIDPILDEFTKLGYKVFHDPALAMMLDIEKRGWFVNPWSKTQ